MLCVLLKQFSLEALWSLKVTNFKQSAKFYFFNTLPVLCFVYGKVMNFKTLFVTFIYLTEHSACGVILAE